MQKRATYRNSRKTFTAIFFRFWQNTKPSSQKLEWIDSSATTILLARLQNEALIEYLTVFQDSTLIFSLFFFSEVFSFLTTRHCLREIQIYSKFFQTTVGRFWNDNTVVDHNALVNSSFFFFVGFFFSIFCLEHTCQLSCEKTIIPL